MPSIRPPVAAHSLLPDEVAVDESAAWSDAQQRLIRDQLARLLQADELRQAPRQQRLLRHIVEATLSGEATRLKGYTLGVEVFDRGADFDPNGDPLVRVEAGRLRGKLLAHYATVGAGDAVVIDIPKGGYAARFVFRDGAMTDSERESLARRSRRSLPIAAERLFGRDDDVAALLELLAQHRIVTVIGPGGVGKTVFALAAAHAWVADEREDAVWVDLAPLAQAALVPATMARAFGLPASPGDEPLRGLLAALRSRAGLLVLDNAEHLLDAIAHVVRELLDHAPGLRMLVTSQAPLQLGGERRFRLDALALPAPDAPLALARQAAAVAYFADRAAALDHRFVLGDDNIASIVRICHGLEGLPLAIRVAAGRLHLLGLSALEGHLKDRLRWPALPNRDAPDRQQTLRAALQWSCGLLSAPQQALFRRLGVFAGSFSLELAHAATAQRASSGCGEAQFADELDGLVERSLVDIVAGDPPRFRLLETQRAWALHELDRLGEQDDARRLHARACANALESATHDYWRSADAVWLPGWAAELDNIRAALRWSREHEPHTAVRLVASAERLFRVLDLAHELRRIGNGVEADAPAHTLAGVDDAVAAQFHLAMASLEVNSASRRHEHAARAEAHARRSGDAWCLYLSLAQRVTSWFVEAEAALPLMAQIEALESPSWPPRLRCRGWLAKCTFELLRRRWQPALQAAEVGFELAVQAGATLAKGAIGNIQLVAMLSAGQIDEALERSAVLRSHVVPGPADTTILFCGTCARLWLTKGDPAAARRLLAEMFDLCRAVDWCRFEPFANLYLGLALTERRDETAAQLLGYAESATRRAWGLPRYADSREAARTELRQRLDPARLEALCAQGATLSPEAVCALTLGATLPRGTQR